MSFNDYVKYITQQFTSYIDTPAEEKKGRRQNSKSVTPVYSSRWLGVIPFILKAAKKNMN
nr:YqzE family protein [Lentibacillus persicus]